MHLAKVSRIAERKSFLPFLLLLWFYSTPEIEACLTYPCNGCRTSGATSFTYCTTQYRRIATQYTTSCGFLGWDRCGRTRYSAGSYTQYHSCSVTCCSGYSAQSNQCRDVNECASNNGGCSQNCNNRAGSYSCSCNSGYSLNGNGRSCNDINECATNNGGCGHHCHNSVGSYSCSCNSGYRLNGDGRRCDDIDECALNTDGCDINSNCENTAGSFRCNCYNGYQLSTTSSTTCLDVDECAPSGTNQCDHNCHNNVGSYTCSCTTGYMLSGPHNCVDVNECTSMTLPHDCHQGCVNNVGSFSCTCLTGYELSGRTQCNDINECSVGKPCDHSCANTEGSYTCSCNTGYRLSGLTSCIDIDECSESPYPCDQYCHNNVASFTCTCRAGYNLVQGHICQDIDECATNKGGCAHFCSNQIGSYQCSCDTGYVLETDRHMCAEFNPLNPPSVQPADAVFIQSITQYLVGGGCGADLCSCARSMFQALQSQSLGTTNGDYELIMDSINLKEVGDIMYALFGSGTTLALPITSSIKTLRFDCSTSELITVSLPTDRQMRFFPNIVVINNVYLTFKVSLAGATTQLSYVALSGQSSLGGMTFTTTIDLTQSTQWKISTTLSGTVDIITFVKSAFNVDIPITPFSSIQLQQANLNAVVDVQGDFSIILQLAGNGHIGNWLTSDMYVIVYHSLANIGRIKPKVSVFTGCTSIYSTSLSSFLPQISSIDVSDVRFFDSLQLPNFHISYASDDFSISDSNLQPLAVPQGCIVPRDNPGFRYIFDFVHSSQHYQWALSIDQDLLVFKPVLSAQPRAHINHMYALVTSSIITPSTVSLLAQRDLGNHAVESMSLNASSKELNVTVTPSSDEIIVLIRGSAEVLDNTVIYQLVLNKEKDIEDKLFIVEGGFSFVGINFGVTIEGRSAGSYFMRACSDFYVGGLSGMLGALNPAFAILPFMEAVGVLRVGLLSPCFESTFTPGTYPSSFCVVSDLARSSLATVTGTACIDYGNVYYLGLEIKDFIFATPLSSFMGNFATQTPFLTTKTNAAVVHVSSAASSLPMSGQLYTDLVNHFGGALEGFTVYSITGWPSGCSSSGMCSIMYDLLGPDTIFFIFAYLKPNADSGVFERIYIEAGLKNFKLGSLSMSYASLFMDFSPAAEPGDTPSYTFGVQAAIILPVEPVITLHGLIAVTLSKNVRITIEFAMQGCWVGAFGIEILDICDLFLAATMTVGNPYPTGGAFGMRIKLGHPDCFRYDAQGYVRIDTEDPESADNYVYVNVRSPVTLQSFFDFLCSGVQLPSFLGEHGFPEGFYFTYAADDAVIPQLALFIPKGIVFNGTLSWYGVKVAAYLYVNLPDVVEAKAEIYPMNLAGGLIKLYRSRSEAQRGPFLSVVMRTAPLQQFTAEASGYVSVLGIEAEVIFHFNQLGYELYMYGNIFNILEANMRIYASVGSVYNAEFGIEANLTTGLFKAIEDGVVAFLRGAADAAEAAISAPQEALRFAQRAFDLLNEEFRKAQSAVAGARRDVANTRGEIANIRHQLDHVICRYKSCGSVCIPFLCGCGCEVKVFGECIVPCLKWDSCCFKAPDPICLLYNAGCFLIRLPVELALLVVQGVLLIVEGALLVVEGILLVAQLAVEAAKLVLEVAILALEVIKQLFKFALQALEAIAKFLLTGLIDIRAMGFDVKLGLLSHGHVRAWVDVSFLRASPVHLSITLPIFNPLALIADFAESCIPGIGRKKRAIRSLDKVKWLANNFRRTGSIYPRLSSL